MRRAALGVFIILWASGAYFWHARDWNTASRLMLTYALVDRGTVRIDGFEHQTGDRAKYRGHSYSDKLPGFSFAAAVPYACLKRVMGWPDHPVNVEALAHWPADYWVTLFTSGLATALCGATLTILAGDLGCGPRRAALVGLAYGLATPAFAYATLAHGHQLSAACLLGSFALLWRQAIAPCRENAGTPDLHPPHQGGSGSEGRSAEVKPFLAGFLAAYASVVELQVGPASAVLGLYALAVAFGHPRRWRAVLAFGLGAVIATAFLLVYDTIAFGSPWRMGYFFHATQPFAEVHSASNPLGLRSPDWSRLDDLTIRPARGLLRYAPIAALTLPGLVALAVRRFVGMASVCTAIVAAVFLVNLSYPEWSGGWSTGPRLLTPMLPFAVLPVAALLAVGGRVVTAVAAVLTVSGAGVILLFQGVGARVPNPIDNLPPGVVDPLREPLARAVLPAWEGGPVPAWTFGHRFARNLAALAAPETIGALPPSWQWLQFAPLVAFQAAAIGLLMWWAKGRESTAVVADLLRSKKFVSQDSSA